MIKRFTLFLILTCAFLSRSIAQNITIGTIEPGPYGKGSTISVPLLINDPSGELLPNNDFKLYLSDGNGSFANEQLIGSYNSHYTTFVNGLLPTGLQAGTYKVRIKSTAPVTVSEASGPFMVSNSNGIQASVDAPTQTLSTNPKTFGSCASGRSNTRFNFTNSSTSGARVTATATNGFVSTDVKQLSFEGVSTVQLIADVTYYTLTVKAELNGVISTYSYFIVNTTQNTPFSTFGSNTVCLPNGSLKYGVESTSSSSGIQSNFPGYTYRINWGDQAIETYTINQIKNKGGIVEHSYSRSSCGSQVVLGSVRYYNVFGIGMQLMSPFCNEIGTPVSTQAKVVTQPENRFGLPGFACLNTQLTIGNNSVAGENPSSTSPECNNNNVQYFWYVDNVLVTPVTGVPITYALKYTFTTKGPHTIRLESTSNSDCQASPLERTILIQAPPQPSFTLSSDLACISSSVKTTNSSIVDDADGAPNSFKWVIEGPAAPVFVNGTSADSKDAEFLFSKAGIYTVALTANSSCQPVTTAKKTIIVNEQPVVTANWQANLCGKGQLLNFSNTQGNPVTTSFSGTFKDEPNTYKWEISGGGYEFRNNTTSASKEPVIFFSDYGVYTVKITVKNNCGTNSVSKTLAFNESPTVSAGPDVAVCAGEKVQLNGSLSGPPVAGFSWVGGTGTFVPNRNVLNPLYIPSLAEVTAGTVQLSLSATTTIPAPCDRVADVTVITIYPPNKITTAPSAEICTGTNLTYSPRAVIANSTIRWTATGTTNAQGFSTSGTGDILQTLKNTDPYTNAKVTYTIVPEANGCSGEPFTFTVTITPLPTVQATAPNATICTGQRTGISLIPSISGTKFTWTSSVNGTITGSTNQTTPTSATSINDLLLNTGNTAGSITYVVTPINSTGCAGTPATITINVTAPPIVADAGQDQKLCSAGQVKLNGNHPGSGAGKWLLISTQTGVTFDDDTKIDPVVKGLKPGQVYRFKWTISGPGTCNSSSDEVQINNLSEISNNIITYSGSTVCEGASISIAGSTPTGGDASSYLYTWESSKDGITWTAANIASQKDFTVIVTESTYFHRIIKSGSCTSVSGVVKVEVQKGISNNNITTGNQHICTGTAPTILQGTLPAGADGTFKYQWQQSPDGTNWSVIIGATTPIYQAPALTTTTYFRRVVSSTICTGAQQNASNAVQIKVSKGAIANYNWLSESSCAPFIISKENIKAEASDPGDIYEWFANDKSIGKSIDFPGFTLPNPGDEVDIRLEVTSALGCGTTKFSHTFKTNSTLTAEFVTSTTIGCGSVAISFTNRTKNTEGVDFEWNFGNGQVSYQRHPTTITYTARADNRDTTYMAVLKAKSKCAISMDTVYIQVYGKPTPKFSPSTVEGCSPLTVTFRNSSPSVSGTYTWNFGDGSPVETYTDNRSVRHIFTTGKSRTFTITLTQKNACGDQVSLSHSIKVAPNTVTPDLFVEPAQTSGCAPLTVKFFNYTTGAKSYAYMFEDGTDTIRTNSDEPIEHTFWKGGVYKVKLIASNCSDTTAIKTITVYEQAEAKFTADITEGCGPLSVKFNNETKNAIYQFWDFGNGKTFIGANPPAQIYSAVKPSYTVKLITKSNYGCMDTLVMKDYIKVTAQPLAGFDVLPGDVIQYPDFRFRFKNTSTGAGLKYNWDFGDRTIDTSKDPEHLYPDTGSYKVKLIVSNSLGCNDVTEHTVRITGTPGNLYIPNAFMPNSASEELRRFRAKGSGIDKFQFKVFNKWGETLWVTDKLDEKGVPVESWDGTFNGSAVPQGVYFWEVKAFFKNGNEWAGMSYNNGEPKKTGVIHLIR
ncbi:PKD domain-containing protein [Desertivirga arenae]|uniref:PKD domain-containing protein n=1 Tax=Desertivirga arenae TaxID=2810309 RepID=UPI001A959E3E|nr:PKD domain-containing protein [Pedobacter sp. SYSU D00823]